MKKLISIDIVIRDSFDGREERHEPVAQPVDPEKPIVTTNGGEGYTPVSIEQPEGDIIINRVCPPNCKGNITVPPLTELREQIAKIIADHLKLSLKKWGHCAPDYPKLADQILDKVSPIVEELKAENKKAFDKGVHHGTTIRNLNWNEENHKRHGEKMRKQAETYEAEICRLKENQCEPDLCTNYVLTPDEAHLVDKTRAESKAEINKLKIDNEALENIRQEYFKEMARLRQENEGLRKIINEALGICSERSPRWRTVVLKLEEALVLMNK